MKNDRNNSFIYSIYLLPNSFNLDHLIEKSKIRKFSNVTLQVLDPTWVISKRQISVAIYHTEKAFDEERNFARDKATEFLIRISGQRQIKNALTLFGVQENSKQFLVVAFGGSKEENGIEKLEFTKNINFKIESSDKKSLPFNDIKNLSKFYKSEESIQDIERAALEKMAAIEIY